MLTVYDAVDGVLVKRESGAPITLATVWIDLHNPTRDEDTLVEQALSILVPTREEMSEIEASSRLYQESGAHVMTAILLTQSEKDKDASSSTAIVSPASGLIREIGHPVASPVTFILAGHRLVTVRYITPRAFDLFLNRAAKKDAPCMSGQAVIVGLLEAVIDRAADRVERIQLEVDQLSQTIFGVRGGERTRSRRFDVSIREIGREGELTSRSRESLLSLDRLLTYLAHVMGERGDEKPLRARVKTASRDVQSLADHVGYLSTKITFLLDATLGMINNEQNTIIKIFSVLAVALMPPTLVGTVYGMNFKHIPELDWVWGYPFALTLMVVSAVLPWLYFKRKGWL
jgi:magnesium transporter